MHIGIDLVYVPRINDYAFRAGSISKTLQEIFYIDNEDTAWLHPIDAFLSINLIQEPGVNSVK